MNKSDLENMVEDYGYFKGLPDRTQLAGRSAMMVEYMAIVPKKGKKQQLIDAAKKVNILLNEDVKKFGAKDTEVLTFQTQFQPVLKEMVREVVKGRAK